MEKIIKKYKFTIINNNEIIDKNNITALGIGDILISLNLLKLNLINYPIYINLRYFKNNFIYHNPINFLDFRLKLINHLCDYNDIDKKKIVLINEQNNINSVNEHIKDIPKIYNWKLKFKIENISNIYLNNKYIIFHTKCRFIGSFNYKKLKNDLNNFYKQFKTNYIIIILGEQEIVPYKGEEVHKITTIYNELIELKKNNNVIEQKNNSK